MRTRTLFVALCWAAPLSGQASYSITQVVNHDNRATVSLLFRNANAYTDAKAVLLAPTFLLFATEGLRATCLADAFFCQFGGGTSFAVGAVQTGPIQAGAVTLQSSGRYVDNGCNTALCLEEGFAANFGYGVGVFGCRVPATLVSYAYRTCDADGFTGAIGLDITFMYLMKDNRLLTLTPSDFGATFQNVTVTTNPEPGTWALLALGLSVAAVVHRRRATR